MEQSEGVGRRTSVHGRGRKGGRFLEKMLIDVRPGVNAIRAYNLDPYLNHDGCASIFNAVSPTF